MDDKTYRRMFSPGSCSCGKSFRSMAAEAVHRHNFPALCRPLTKRKEAARRLRSAEEYEAEVKQHKLNKRADEALDALGPLLARPLSTRRYIDARAAVLAAMKWAVDNA